MTAFRNLGTGLLATVVAAAAGCGKPFNEQIGLVGTDTPLPALADAVETTELTGTPSLQHGLDRQTWSPVTVQVPRDQVGHYPTYAKNFRWQKDRGPWNPAYPTTPDVTIDVSDAGQDLADGVTEPFFAAGMLVWMPIDMIFFNQPWDELRSPSEPYALVPERDPAHLVSWFDSPPKPPVTPADAPTGDASDPADRVQPHP